MADVLRDGMAWLARQMKAHASESIVYSRGTLSVALSATVGRTMLRLTDGYGNTKVEYTDRDYLIPAADLVAGGIAEPERGDKVRETHGGETRVYEVLPYENESCWRWADEHHTVFRVHVKEVATE